MYYSKVAKYLNEHRKFSIDTKPLGFENSTGFYTNSKFPPAFDIWSTHLVSLYVIQIVSGIMFSSIAYFLISSLFNNVTWSLILSVLSGLISILINLLVYVRYMKKQDNKFGLMPSGNNS